MNRRHVRRLVAIVWLALVWTMLWGTWSVANLASGAAVALLITTLFALPEVRFRTQPSVIGAGSWILWILLDLVKASLLLAYQALKPRVPSNSAVIAVQLESKSELVHALVIESVTIVPGSLVVEFERSRRIVYAHVWGISTDQEIAKARSHILLIERRVVKAVGDRRDMS